MDLNMIKYAMPFVPGVTSTAMGTTKPTPAPRTPQKSSTPAPYVSPAASASQKPSTPAPQVSPALKKRPAESNLNIKNQSELVEFPSLLFSGISESDVPPFYTGIGTYLQSMHLPTPDGVPYRIVDGAVTDYTKSLNESGLFPEKLSPTIHTDTTKTVAKDIPLDGTIYQIDGRDAVNWLYDRRGLQFTDEQWDNAAKARQSVTSQLGALPQSIYYAWSDNNKTKAYSMGFSANKNNNQYFNIFNPDYFDKNYRNDPYNGYTLYPTGTTLTPAQKFMNFQEAQDHELSHSANPTLHEIGKGDKGWITDENGQRVLKDHMFFRKTNDPLNPYYDDATTTQRVKDYQQLFSGTYLQRPSEYIGAMARAKRYGAELGFDTTNSDPVKARAAMAKTLHYLANHKNPQDLTVEQQRLNSWLNTAAGNSMKLQQKDNQKYKTIQDYIKDPQSPFYTKALDFMTDSTIQGLVRNAAPSNNTSVLQDSRYGYA